VDSSDLLHLGPTEAAAWDRGCWSDEARNRFVIPSVERLINRINAFTVMDVGCGTGYLCQRLSGLDVRWTLLDVSPTMMAFARRALLERDNVSYVTEDLLSAVKRQLVSPHDIIISAYSILEVYDLQGFARACRLAVRDGGVVALYLPDCLEDIAPGSDPAFQEFRAGMTSVRKRNAFTSTELVFLARRVEQYLAVFTTERFALVGLEEFVSGAGKRHFALMFRKIDLDQIEIRTEILSAGI
jgi:SAM-dependent methyltransferase